MSELEPVGGDAAAGIEAVMLRVATGMQMTGGKLAAVLSISGLGITPEPPEAPAPPPEAPPAAPVLSARGQAVLKAYNDGYQARARRSRKVCPYVPFGPRPDRNLAIAWQAGQAKHRREYPDPADIPRL